MRPDSSFIEQPVRSLQTMLRVIALDDSRYHNLIPDGIYGTDTVNAVTAFQRQNNIPITGIADQQTWDDIVAAYEPARIRTGKAEKIEILIEPGVVYVLGDSDPHIYLLQAMLAQLADENIQIPHPAHSGTIDNETARSVRAFQRFAGLPDNGNVDRITWRNLSKQFTLSAHRNTNHL
jgi:peptidoglycan hydrolase-like protein with peptidoglycan-binding domain